MCKLQCINICFIEAENTKFPLFNFVKVQFPFYDSGIGDLTVWSWVSQQILLSHELFNEDLNKRLFREVVKIEKMWYLTRRKLE